MTTRLNINTSVSKISLILSFIICLNTVVLNSSASAEENYKVIKNQKKYQSPLSLSMSFEWLQLGISLGPISVNGGSGSGEVTLHVDSPKVCAVSIDGKLNQYGGNIFGLSPGECVVTFTKSGDYEFRSQSTTFKLATILPAMDDPSYFMQSLKINNQEVLNSNDPITVPFGTKNVEVNVVTAEAYTSAKVLGNNRLKQGDNLLTINIVAFKKIIYSVTKKVIVLGN